MIDTEENIAKQQTQTPEIKSLKNGISSNNLNNLLNKEQQNAKDRTLFCINIDQRCTEDILYELFLQVGPIENINRKADRNGNLICLITYKHVESCEYAIKLFNGISLYGQPLKVQQSQQNALNPSLNRSSSANLNNVVNQQQPSVNHYQNLYNKDRDNSNRDRDRSRHACDSNQSDPQQQQQQQQILMQLIMHNFAQSPVGLMGSPGMMPPTAIPSLMGNFNNNNNFNRSRSGPNLQDLEHDQANRNSGQHNSRRNFDRSGGNNFDNNRRDSSRNYQHNNGNNNYSRDSSYHNRHSRDHHSNNKNKNSPSRSRSPRRNNNNNNNNNNRR